jgi:hypothetical protein
MFASCKKQPVGSPVYLLARKVFVFPGTMNYLAELAIAEDHRQKEAAKRQQRIDAEAAYEEQEAAIPLTEYEKNYRNRWGCRNMTNGRLRKEISWRPDPSSC